MDSTKSRQRDGLNNTDTSSSPSLSSSTSLPSSSLELSNINHLHSPFREDAMYSARMLHLQRERRLLLRQAEQLQMQIQLNHNDIDIDIDKDLNHAIQSPQSQSLQTKLSSTLPSSRPQIVDTGKNFNFNNFPLHTLDNHPKINTDKVDTNADIRQNLKDNNNNTVTHMSKPVCNKRDENDTIHSHSATTNTSASANSSINRIPPSLAAHYFHAEYQTLFESRGTMVLEKQHSPLSSSVASAIPDCHHSLAVANAKYNKEKQHDQSQPQPQPNPQPRPQPQPQPQPQRQQQQPLSSKTAKEPQLNQQTSALPPSSSTLSSLSSLNNVRATFQRRTLIGNATKNDERYAPSAPWAPDLCMGTPQSSPLESEREMYLTYANYHNNLPAPNSKVNTKSTWVYSVPLTSHGLPLYTQHKPTTNAIAAVEPTMKHMKHQTPVSHSRSNSHSTARPQQKEHHQYRQYEMRSGYGRTYFQRRTYYPFRKLSKLQPTHDQSSNQNQCTTGTMTNTTTLACNGMSASLTPTVTPRLSVASTSTSPSQLTSTKNIRNLQDALKSLSLVSSTSRLAELDKVSSQQKEKQQAMKNEEIGGYSTNLIGSSGVSERGDREDDVVSLVSPGAIETENTEHDEHECDHDDDEGGDGDV